MSARWLPCVLGLLLVASAATAAPSGPSPDVQRLSDVLAAMDADPAIAGRARLERYQAAQAVARLADEGEGGVHHPHLGVARAPGQPVGRDQGVGHGYSSQLGTGRPFSRRNGGLKILD